MPIIHLLCQSINCAYFVPFLPLSLLSLHLYIDSVNDQLEESLLLSALCHKRLVVCPTNTIARQKLAFVLAPDRDQVESETKWAAAFFSGAFLKAAYRRNLCTISKLISFQTEWHLTRCGLLFASFGCFLRTRSKFKEVRNRYSVLLWIPFAETMISYKK